MICNNGINKKACVIQISYKVHVTSPANIYAQMVILVSIIKFKKKAKYNKENI